MAVSQVRALFNGAWVTLAYNAETRRYETTLTAAGTSYHEPDGAYSITVEVTNDSGAVSTVDGGTVPGLNLVVLETTPPTLTLEAPAGAFVTTAQPEIVLTAVDEAGGSGVDPESLSLTRDGAAWPGTVETETVENGVRFRFAPAEPLPEGLTAVSAAVQDHDGNRAEVTAEFTVDTVPPVLTVDRALTLVDTETITLTGRAVDATTGPVTVTLTDNGETAGMAEFDGDRWRFVLPLTVGEHSITVTAADRAGWTTETGLYVIRLVTDRAQSDVDALNALLSRAANGTLTDAEWAELAQARARGGYNHTDLNRVTAAVQYLGGELHRRGYLDPRRSAWNGAWDVVDTPSVINFDTYAGNVRRIWAALPNEAPAPPETLDALTVSAANALERALVAVDAVFPLLDRSAVMAGECMAGEF